MSLKLGNVAINKIYLGTTAINKVYLGVNQIFPTASGGGIANWVVAGSVLLGNDEFGIETVSGAIDLSSYDFLAFTVVENGDDGDSDNFIPRFQITDGVDTFTQGFSGASPGTDVYLSIADAVLASVNTSAVRIRILFRSFNELVSGDFAVANLRAIPDENDLETYDVIDDFNATPYVSDLTWRDYESGTGTVTSVTSGDPFTP